MILERPVWNTLATRHASFAVGGDRARRFAPDIGPLAGARDDEPESLAALVELVRTSGPIILLQAPAVVLPAGLVATMSEPGVQMVLDRLVESESEPEPEARVEARDEPRIEPLTADDVPAMIALAALTKPGPFAARTNALGGFYGIKAGGVLLAMAGERMKHDGYVEVSGVCTHPDARGRGFARRLSAHVARRIALRGEVPYLHAFATNTAAIALYESLGFRLRSEMHVMGVALAEQPLA
jgi:predicted GNAT family acetyltransferase